MKKVLLMAFAAILATASFAQDEDSENLVPNYNFELTEGRSLKKAGGLDEFCEEWVSGTREMADVFSSSAKSDKVSVPKNQFGEQEAMSAGNYAGFTAYSKDAKKGRSYITVKLSDELEENQQYCIKFNVSLADLSKYAVNNIGMFVSTKKVLQSNTSDMLKKPQIKDITNKVLMDMEGWETICGTFVATGDEEYIVIGCFAQDDKLKIEKMKKPSGMAGAQVYQAYYYLDEISIEPIAAKSQCACSALDASGPAIIYSKNIVYGEDMTVEDKINLHAVYFANLTTDINALNNNDLKKLLELLNSNPSVKINVIGHSTSDEMDEARLNTRFKDLGLKRANKVADYLIANGVSASRIEASSLDDSSPANTRKTPLSIAQNRRVVISVR